MKTLQDQIAELTAKHELQNSVESKLPNIGCKIYTNAFNYKAKGTTKTFTVHLDELPIDIIADKIQVVLAAFPPTGNNTLTFAGKDNQPTESPFVLRFNNGIHDKKAQIEYNSNEYWIHINVPVDFYSDAVKTRYYRGVSDCEHHYFGGVSMSEIHKMQLPAYKLSSFEVVKYYGGSAANYITNADKRNEFETIVLTGKK